IQGAVWLVTGLAANSAWPQSRSLFANFESNAANYSEDNAYVLAYLSTLVYPQNIAIELQGVDQTEFERDLQTDPVLFFTNYMERVNDLAGPESVDYAFVTSCLPSGWDPEAVVMNTSRAIIVVFRGTDRVGCAPPNSVELAPLVNLPSYDVAEWLGSNFDIGRFELRYPVTNTGTRLYRGTVHRGFWNSLASNPTSAVITRGALVNSLPVRPPVQMKAPAASAAITETTELLPSNVLRTIQSRGMRGTGTAPRLQTYNRTFIESVEATVREFATASPERKIWLTGHSLGGAHAQLTALYLKRKGFDIQGVYAFAGPNVGDKELADEIDALFPGHRATRFAFAADPIPTLTNNVLGFDSGGRVMHFDDLQTRQSHASDASLVSGAGALARLGTGAVAAFVPINTGLDIMCFHYPQWYLNAAWNDLIKRFPQRLNTVRGPMIPPPDTRIVGSGRGSRALFAPCNRDTIARGTSRSLGNAIGEAAAGVGSAVADAALQFAYDAVYALGNEIGNPEFEGRYRIVNYASVRAGRNKMLDRDSNKTVNLSAVGSSDADNIWVVKRSGIGGYTIGIPNSHRLFTPTAEGPDLFANNHGYALRLPEIEISDCPFWNPFCGATVRYPSIEQTWRFYKLREAGNLFLIENRLGSKVIDANDACSVNADRDCRIKQWDRLANNATQLWVLQRVD
ncbi:MAG: lipase family protein, partial [Steroidobacteraceae bacterium]|nr:lipase family protein [Steroidobacteraceae bacterium]